MFFGFVCFFFKYSCPESVIVKKAHSESALVDFILGEGQIHYKGLSYTVFYGATLEELGQFLPFLEEKSF